MVEQIDENLGPAMLALNEKQRRFVLLVIDSPGMSGSAAARRCGYAEAGVRVRSHRLLHSERVLKAINEELDRRFRADTIVARHVLLEIAGSAAHPAAARLRAAEALLNRGGFAAEQKIKVEHTDTSSEAMVEKIKRLAIELKLDPAALLGGNTQAMKLIEATAVDVEPVPAAAPAPADITA